MVLIKHNSIHHYLLQYTELIWEFGTTDKPDWVHVAIAKGREQEKNAKIAYREDGKAKYMKFEDWVWG